MAKSILQKDKTFCFLCGEAAGMDPLDKHHVFGGTGKRKLSEKYGLWVYLHHFRCHEFGKESVHQNAESSLRLKRHAQERAMEVYGWSKEEFRGIIGKNYL